MIRDILHQRINDYAPANAIEQENVLQELMQHYVLVSLSKAGLFAEAVFHGGTCLRILYGTSRFSEDLDFLLKKHHHNSNGTNIWKQYRKIVYLKESILRKLLIGENLINRKEWRICLYGFEGLATATVFGNYFNKPAGSLLLGGHRNMLYLFFGIDNVQFVGVCFEPCTGLSHIVYRN